MALDKDAFYVDLGQKVRAVREERKLTQEALASLLGITRTSVTNIEKGRQKMFLHTFLEIAQGLSVSPDALMPSMQYSSSLEDALKEQLNQKELNWVQEAMNEIQRD
ncbi:MAG: helix-turn-helix transcriptional regulator [Cyanobacteria bacterium P01_A01_bin.137]